ncbi:MAG TPA: hypothetical protein EYH00_01215 [Archaeoglobus profundus]|nr:hypothetical protein [Archaeoglobus profundus]
MKVKIIPSSPAILIEGRCRKLLIADIHLGLVSFYDLKLIEMMKKLVDKTRADEVLVIGDLKHKIGDCQRVDKIIQSLDFTITLVKGNHDGGIKGLEVLSSRGIRLGKIGVFHGHAKPSEDVMEADILIFAHAHPSVLIMDRIGGSKVQVWLFGEFEDKKVIVMPAFNDLCSFTPINLEKPVGVMFKVWNYEDAEAVTLDGTLLGKIKFLKEYIKYDDEAGDSRANAMMRPGVSDLNIL